MADHEKVRGDRPSEAEHQQALEGQLFIETRLLPCDRAVERNIEREDHLAAVTSVLVIRWEGW